MGALRSRFVLITCIQSFCFDIGYWIAMDIPDIGGPLGEIQTYIVSTACILAALDLKDAHSDVMPAEWIAGVVLPVIFILVALFRKIADMVGVWPGYLTNTAVALNDGPQS